MVQVKAKTALENFNDDGHFLISFRRGGGAPLLPTGGWGGVGGFMTSQRANHDGWVSWDSRKRPKTYWSIEDSVERSNGSVCSCRARCTSGLAKWFGSGGRENCPPVIISTETYITLWAAPLGSPALSASRATGQHIGILIFRHCLPQSC